MEKDLPRYVLSLTDTKTIIPGANGDQYFNITAGSDKLTDFTKRTKDPDGKNRNEVQRMFVFFAEQVDKMGSRPFGKPKKYDKVKIDDK